MKLLQTMTFAALLPLVAGCRIDRGCFDFANPIFDVHFGDWATVVCFPDCTVLQIGSTYCTINMPFYVLVILTALAIFILAWFTDRFSPKKSSAGVS